MRARCTASSYGRLMRLVNAREAAIALLWGGELACEIAKAKLKVDMNDMQSIRPDQSDSTK